MRLRLTDIEFDSGSVVDPAGKVFHYDGRVFRAISKEYAGIYRKFLAMDSIQDIFKAGLIETWISDINLEGIELVLEHKKIPVLSSWSEWCSEMAKDATKEICQLNFELSKHGYITKDTQPGNIQFIDGTPYWIDFGSIVPIDSHGSFRFEEFRYHSFLPLWLNSKGFRNLATAMYKEVGMGFLKSTANRKPYRWFPIRYKMLHYNSQKKNELSSKLESLLEYIDTLKINPDKSFWSDYGQGGMPPVNKTELFKEKASAVYNLLENISPGLILDMAGNKGWYAELATSLGHRAISFDIDDASVCNLYRRVKKQELPILPLVLNFLYPTPAYSIGLGKASAYERLQADIVLALAITHHLIFNQNVFFEPIVDIIANYTRKIAIIEFVPKEDKYVREWFSQEHYWYSLDNFIKVCNRRFSNIEVYDSSPAPRKLLMCFK